MESRALSLHSTTRMSTIVAMTALSALASLTDEAKAQQPVRYVTQQPTQPPRYVPQPVQQPVRYATQPAAQPVRYAAQPAQAAARPAQPAQAAARPAQAQAVARPAGDPYGFTGWLNSVRAMHGLAPVGYDPNLASWAAVNNSHQASRGMGHYVMGPARYQNSAVGSAATVGQQWLASPAHRAAMLDPSVRFIGLAGYGAYWTLNAY